MESYGELLRKTREEKNLDLDKIAREISIEKRYLEGLETENSSVFPGEAYLTGFLRNYSAYLELDSDFVLKLYRNKQIQEAAVPEGLYAKPKVSRILLPSIIIPSVLIVGVVIVLLILLLNKNKTDPNADVVVSANQRNRQYELSDKKFIHRVYKGDQLLIPTNKDGQIILTVRDTLSSFGIDTPSGVYYVELSEESEIDINGDSTSDMIVYVSDISSTDESRGAEISVLLRQGLSRDVANVIDQDIPFASEISSKHPQKVILEDNRAYPFTINASFRGPCLFRDKVDNSESVETYFNRGEVFTATPHNGIRLWISNNNTVKFSIIADSKSYDLDIGTAGQVFVEDIKWIKDTDGKYKLVVIELD
ncbi:MAG: helix-turn-helix domain-containing protein [Treponema sp.]|nr:helix-turn-helix domain-containing protein [Treponema sp.]